MHLHLRSRVPWSKYPRWPIYLDSCKVKDKDHLNGGSERLPSMTEVGYTL